MGAKTSEIALGPFHNVGVELIEDFDIADLNALRPGLGVESESIVISRGTIGRLYLSNGQILSHEDGRMTCVVQIIIEEVDGFPGGAAAYVPLDILRIIRCSS